MHLKRRRSSSSPGPSSTPDATTSSTPQHRRKRARPYYEPPLHDLISQLPAELLVRILSNLPESTLISIAPVSKLFHRVTSDAQLWRGHYYRRFILPRAHLIPGFRKSPTAVPTVSTSPRKKSGGKEQESVDWKNAYKLLHNWARGRCEVDELELHQQPNTGKTLVKVVEGLAITADAASGLIIWDLRTRLPVARTKLGHDARPMCLAVDEEALSEGEVDIAVGFGDGTLGVWKTDLERNCLVLTCRTTEKKCSGIEGVAYCHPFILAASGKGQIFLYTLDHSKHHQPHLLRSLRSQTVRSPTALSMRRVGVSVVASMAYTIDTIDGWSLGVQDLDIMSRPGHILPEVVHSRVAHSPSSGIAGRPRGLCYSHPYLLATLPDNTLLLHLCTATAAKLTISPGIRLWGHTSGISDAEITTRGKAVSVSAKGNEIRVWELEGRLGGRSIEVRPRLSDKEAATSTVGVLDQEMKNKVGFDEEMVIVLKEQSDGRESLMVYDFR
ncbi:F-box domain-containing protein [Emericellopsis atlantica]|uniref:F-box domain-containing protein n=1 Tax=Emericellopsis atlantica TaxID=2614577 RepID=A0A9P7ZL74_9HYPO|nr:F-box domain-containing protein [Emericellopsis atlantica]KAG9254050.1 F-box domain-containing protein [Emericellopsis atlantica]